MVMNTPTTPVATRPQHAQPTAAFPASYSPPARPAAPAHLLPTPVPEHTAVPRPVTAPGRTAGARHVTSPRHRAAPSAPDPAVSRASGAPAASRANRYRVLDALRGFAVAGILLVNIGDITDLGRDVPMVVGGWRPSLADTVLYYLVSTRFVTVFAFMFGMSMMFVVDSARRRGARVWTVLGRRLLVLLGFGLLHTLVYPGEVLTTYAVGGLLVMPLVIWAPRWLTACLGVVGTVASFALTGSGIGNLPGLFLLGAATVAYGLPAYLECPDRRLPVVTLVLVLATVPALWWQAQTTGDPRFETAGGVAGGVQATVYICLVALICASPLRRAFLACFEPLGRMSLSCYVGATLVVLPIGMAAHWTQTRDVVPLLAVAAVVLVVQSLVARVWLRFFRYGPLEWIWRCLTWWKPQPLLAAR